MKYIVIFSILSTAIATDNFQDFSIFQGTMNRAEFERLLHERMLHPSHREKAKKQMLITSSGAQFWLNERDKLNWLASVENPAIVSSFEQQSMEPIFTLRFGKNSPPQSRQFVLQEGEKPLSGLRVFLNPAHFGGDLRKIEQRYVHLQGKDKEEPFHEGELTLLTAKRLQTLLEKLGATVMMARNEIGETGAVNKSFNEWLKDNGLVDEAIDAFLHKHVTRYKGGSGDRWKSLKPKLQGEIKGLIDSRLTIHDSQLESTDPELRDRFKFYFRRLYNKQEISKRAELAEAFNPHVSLTIDFNGGGIGTDGKHLHSAKNSAFGLVPGSFWGTEISDNEQAHDFLRILLNTQLLHDSVNLCSGFVNALHRFTNVPIAERTDFKSLQRAAMPILDKVHGGEVAGVFARNHDVSQQLQGVVCNGEAFVQTNPTQAERLALKDIEIAGVRTSRDIEYVAQAYLEGILGLYGINPESIALTKLGFGLRWVNPAAQEEFESKQSSRPGQ